MNQTLNIETILGDVANISHLRASRSGKEFEGILPVPVWSEEIVKRNGSVQDTVKEMQHLIKQYAYQTSRLSKLLKGQTLDETCQNIWNFLYTHIKYKEDEEGKEQLRTPARSFAQRLSRGIDCDDFSIFASSLLYNLNIPHYIRIARYSGKDYFQHVYVVVPQTQKKYITIDAVLDDYDTEKEPAETKDFLVMNTNSLSGIDISVLGAVEEDTLNEISGILSGADFQEIENIEGLGQVATEEQGLNAIRQHLLRTRNIIANRPELIRETEHPESFLGMVDYALKYWDTDKRDDALGVLAAEEDRLNEIEGLGQVPEGHEDVELFYGLNTLGSFDVLGKVKRQRKFFTKVKEAAKKVGKGIKKVTKALVRYNPLTATIRAAVLLALKVNLMKAASKLKWGYLTEAEAQAHGFDMNEWRKVKTQLAKAEKMFVDVLQGKAENFKRAILNGRAGKLSGTDIGLGVVAATATAASATAAVPFITKIINLLKNINFKKLVSKVNVSSLVKRKKQAETDTPTEDGDSAIPENDTTSSENSNENTSSNENDTGASETENGVKENDSSESQNDNPDNLPAVQSTSAQVIRKIPEENNTQEGFLSQAMNWVKEHKTTSILIGAGAAFLIYEMVKPKPKTALSGMKRTKGKKKKGQAKNHPPQTVSGTTHSKTKRRKRHPVKTRRKGRGKGGSHKRITL